MATVPLSGTNVRLLSSVPFSNDYKNTRWFDNVTDQTTYFTTKPVIHSMSEANFQRIEGKQFIAVNKSIDALWTTNYLMFQNATYNAKWFYAFVTKLEYVNKSTTNVHFQLDVFQTWKFQMDFKPSYVIREHCKLWNEDGSPVINTVDEGLNYGTDYETVSIKNYIPYKDIYFLVVVAKAVMHGGATTPEIKPMINASPQPLTYYVHPFKKSGSSPKANWNSTEFELDSVLDVLNNLYKQDDAVNNIVSLYVTDYIGKDLVYDEGTDVLTFPQVNFSYEIIQDTENSFSTFYVKDVKSYDQRFESFGNKYDDYQDVTESKLLMYPYTTLIMDDFKGNRVEFKNEYINSQNLIVTVRGSLGTSNKVVYGIEQYLSGDLTGSDQLTLSLEKSLINNNPNDIPIITDMLSAYLQGNRNSIKNQSDTIQFNGLMNTTRDGVNTIGSALSGNVKGTFNNGMSMIQGQGNTVLQMQGLQAKQQDINNTPPQITKMGSNTAFDYGNGYTGLFIIKKQIRSEYRKKLSDFFNMFGYKVNEVKIPNFHTRERWNYVQTSSCTIQGSFNHEDLQELKAIFDNGITLWHMDDIGNYELGNGVI